jgi:hypothetical protein
VADVAERLDRLADDPRHVPARVDDRVERAAAKRAEVAVAIAAQLLDLGEEVRVRQAAVEQRDVVAARERALDDRAAEELRAAEDQSSDSASSTRSTSASVL